MIPVNPCGRAMDALRSCYETTMRFPGVGLVPVRWYWTDEPVIEVETVYTSHNHTREEGYEDYDTGQAGEVWGAERRYYKGQAPLPSACSGPEGDEAAWLGLSDNTSPLYPTPGWTAEYDEAYSGEWWSITYANGG